MHSENGTFTLANTDAGLRIEANGNLVAGSVQNQRDFLLDAVKSSPRKVVLSLLTTDQVDSLGITLIMGLFKSCRSSQIPFEVEGVPPAMMRVFQLFSLQKLFPIAAR